MNFNWDRIEAYNQAPIEDSTEEPLTLVAPCRTPNKNLKKIRELAAEGHTKSYAARVLNITPTRVGQLARKNNVKFSNDRFISWPLKKMSYWVGLYARQGCTPKEVSLIINVDVKDIVRFAQESRIEFRKQPNVVRDLLG